MDKLFTTKWKGLVVRAERAGLRDPEAAAAQAVARYSEAVSAGRLPADDADALYLVTTGVIRDELDRASHRLEVLADQDTITDMEWSGARMLVSSPMTADQWLFRESLLGALKNMAPRAALAWLLHNVHGLSFREAGERMGCSHELARREAEAARVQLAKEVYR